MLGEVTPTGGSAALTVVKIALTGVRAALTVVRIALTGGSAALTGVKIALIGVGAALTGVKITLTGVSAVLTGVKIALTGVSAALTVVKIALTGVRAVLTGVKIALTGVRAALTGVKIALTERAGGLDRQSLEKTRPTGPRCPSADPEIHAVLHARSQGYAVFHRANIFRAKGHLQPQAADEFRRAKALWEAGKAGDPERLLNEARVLGMEASFRRAQRQLPEALDLLERALAVDRGNLRAYLLINRANVLEEAGNSEEALAIRAGRWGGLPPFVRQTLSFVSYGVLLSLWNEAMASGYNCDDRFFDLSLELLCIASLEGSFQRLNPAFRTTLGYSPEEMLERPFLAFVHPADKPAAQAALHGLRSGQLTAGFESRYHCKDGSWKWLSWKIQAFPEEGVLYAVARDITEHQQTEKSLVESHRLLQTIIDTIPMRIFWKDKDCRYLGCNPAFARDAGEARPEDLIGKDDYQLSWKAQADLYRTDDQQVMASGIPKLSYEEPSTTADGHGIWLRTSKVPLHDEEDHTIGVLGLYEDITEHKQAKRQLEAELREKETLLREVHHRVKNNLQIISSLLHFQAKKAQKEQELAVFRDGQDRLRAMILVHEKLYRSADLHRISLGDYIHALAAQLHRSFRDVAEPIELCVEAEEIYVPVEIALPCGMIATELVTNVFKYAYPAGESGTVLVRLVRRESSFVLSVADTGAGLPADLDLAHATSFGLQLVANLTEQLSARLTREPGRGTVMCLEVPWPAG